MDVLIRLVHASRSKGRGPLAMDTSATHCRQYMRLLDRFRSAKSSFDAPIEPDRPFCAVGDIHGSAHLLEKMLHRLPGDLPVVFVGDYVDRGDDSAGVLRRLFEAQRTDPDRITCLMGNHEVFLLDFLDGSTRGGAAWLRHGGMQTLGSFGVQPPQTTDLTHTGWAVARQGLAAAMGSDMIGWIRSLPSVTQSGNVAVVHAGADPELPMSVQRPEDLIWGHPDFAKVHRRDGVWVIHGHTIVADPVVRGGRISIDTGAYATGRLTAVVVKMGDTRFVTVD